MAGASGRKGSGQALGDQNGYDHHWLIDPDSRKISLWTEDGGMDADSPEWSEGKGPFRRFKDELHEEYSELLPAGYAFRDARAQRRAVEWLVDNGIVDETQAQNFLAEHPEPDLP